MADRDRAAGSGTYPAIQAVVGGLVTDEALRRIAQTAREKLHFVFAAVSFGLPGFSNAASLFVRDSLLTPPDFAPCAATLDILVVPQLRSQPEIPYGIVKLQSYAGCAVLDWQRNCVGVFYLMDTRPHDLTSPQLTRLRSYADLISSRIEMVRRFGTGSSGASPAELVRRADHLASVGQDNEARDLIALAYAAHDIAGISKRTTDAS